MRIKRGMRVNRCISFRKGISFNLLMSVFFVRVVSFTHPRCDRRSENNFINFLVFEVA